MRIDLTSIFVDDQREALAFYTEVLGFVLHHDIPLGEAAWLTVISPEGGAELLLEPADHPAVGPYREALVRDGIPLAQFAVDDLVAEHARLIERGVVFTLPPTDVGTALIAVFDDTCGNLIQLVQTTAA
ncbi:MAG: bleomycin resistance protein [Microbacterium sp. 71-36]|uniref:VOC family protein n=1 Tax=unclassified Microbacterium TaxID=2609290 RepID=UPI00086D3041|nr:MULTISPECIES: VOC family protein [unclassified Microbacterium]MBN9211752.1 VOC family protein [Microbacterium sp.]ODT37429.1 MAG: bleomycin resistance protein [Microbacterium sp. SCN 71-17]OJV78228.1 MAG: bleomycin resistance protein [Microbacterium sp. 71-36]